MPRSSSLSRPSLPWIVYGTVFVILGAALGWLSFVLLDFETERKALETRERLGARLRLAVWRIDALMAPVLAEEAVRPPAHYVPEPDGGDSAKGTKRSKGGKGKGGVKFPASPPSPLLEERTEWVALHFDLAPDNTWSSPQVPLGAARIGAFDRGVSPQVLADRAQCLEGLARDVSPELLRSRLAQALDLPDEGLANPYFFWNDPDNRAQALVTEEYRSIQTQNDQEERTRFKQHDEVQGGEAVVDVTAEERTLEQRRDTSSQTEYEHP